MADRVFVLTDALSGLGKALALNLARTGETVVMVARDPDQGSAALKEVALATQSPNLELQLCDLSILSSVRNLAEILRSKHQKIDVLINNSSRYKPTRTVTVDGLEEMLAANHLGPFLGTNLLLEWLQAAVQANGSARVLNITAPSKVPLDFEDLQSERNYNSRRTLEATRMANLLFTLALARRLEGTGITVNAVYPGPVPAGSMFTRLFSWLGSRSPEKLSDSIVQAAAAPEFEKITGKFLYNGKEMEVPAYGYDQDAQEQLWKISDELTALSSTKGVMPVNDLQL